MTNLERGGNSGGTFALDLGCGKGKVRGSFGVDIAPSAAVDVLADFRQGLPFRDSSVQTLYAYHLLEHMDDFIGFMEEMWRICAPNATVYVKVPHAASPFVTWKDPTHKRGLFIATFAYFDETYFDGSAFSYYSKAKFRIEKARLNFSIDNGQHFPFMRRAANQLVHTFANGSRTAQYLCERFWGPLVGIEEAVLIMRALK
jgi:ubiquinone/menaquinone biosynthesis C-methylase UbiE